MHEEVLAIDSLHNLSLGVYLAFCMYIVHMGVELDVWKTRESNQEVRSKMSVSRMRAEVEEHYNVLKGQGFLPTEVQEFSVSMFALDGKLGAWGACGLKASETNYFLPYIRDLIARHADVFPNSARLLIACDALLRCQALIRDHPARFSSTVCQDPRPG